MKICRERGKSVLLPTKSLLVAVKECWVNKKGGLTHREMLRQDVNLSSRPAALK